MPSYDALAARDAMLWLLAHLPLPLSLALMTPCLSASLPVILPASYFSGQVVLALLSCCDLALVLVDYDDAAVGDDDVAAGAVVNHTW